MDVTRKERVRSSEFRHFFTHSGEKLPLRADTSVMCFIAGHFSGDVNCSRGEFLTAVQSYRILATDNLSDYENTVLKIPLGCIVAKYKKNYPIPPKLYNDASGGKLLIRFLDDFRADALIDLSYDAQTEVVGSLATMCLTYKSFSNT